MTTKSEDPTAAAETFASRLSAKGYDLDFSRKSLETEVDRFVQSADFNDLETVEKWAAEALLGAYIGETVGRLFDGRWAGEFFGDSNAANFYSSWLEFDSVRDESGDPYRFYPSRFISYRINNGPGDGTFADFFTREASRLEV